MQALNPLAVLHIAFASGHILGLARIDQDDPKAPTFQDLEEGNPIDSRRFHGHAGDCALLKPIRHGFKVRGKGSEFANIFLRTAGRNTGPMFFGTNIDSRGIGIDLFPTIVHRYFFLSFLGF